MTLTTTRCRRIEGAFRAPSDKSLTHRAYMFAAIADGESIVRSPLRGQDCESTLSCLNLLGLRHEWRDPDVVRLIPAETWNAPARPLDCGNSGTTMRLLSGLVASRPLTVRMEGDSSLSRRPMGRIAAPLRLMGASVEGDRPPIVIKGGDLQGIDYVSPVASAQVKSCVLLAGLRASGITRVTEPSPSRDHTERMLQALGIHLDLSVGVALAGGQVPTGFEFSVPGDISSAAFLMTAAILLPGSRLRVLELNVNPTRTGLLDVFSQVGCPVDLENPRVSLGEPVADVLVTAPRERKPFTIEGALVPRLIDEIPVLAVLATQCEGVSVIRDARELRVKESDRIERVAEGLRAMGAQVETFEDGMAITGPTPLSGVTIDSEGDHRLAMAFAVAGLIAEGETHIEAADSIQTSYPHFEQHMSQVVHP